MVRSRLGRGQGSPRTTAARCKGAWWWCSFRPWATPTRSRRSAARSATPSRSGERRPPGRAGRHERRALSSLIEVAKLSHTDLETVATGMAKLSRRWWRPGSGSGKAAQGVRRSGGQSERRHKPDAPGAGRDAGLATALRRHEGPDPRRRLRPGGLGKNGAALLPLLFELARAAAQLHAKFTNESRRAAGEARRQFDSPQAAAGKLKIALASLVVGPLTSLAENLLEAKTVSCCCRFRRAIDHGRW